MNKNQKVKFRDFASINAGQSPKSKYYSKNEGMPFLQGNRTFGRLYPEIDTYTKKVTKIAQKGDILMSVRAPVGDLNFAKEKVCIGRGLAAISAKDNNNQFLFYCLMYNIKNLIKQSGGTTYNSVNKDIINDFDLVMPITLDERISVANILSTIDKKIELNNKINSKLESMAKLIYDYWFVQFDFPDENGKPYKSSGGKMIYNEELKREIPFEWEVKNISEISIVQAGGDKPNEISNTKSDYFNIPIYSNGIQNDGLYGFTTLPKITNPSITVSARGTIGFTALRLEPFVPIVRLICLTPKDKENLNFLYHRISMMNFTDSGSIQKQLTVPMINSLKIVVPKKELLVKFNKLTDLNFNKIRLNKNENKKLTELRDWLLPMLMNGQIKVN